MKAVCQGLRTLLAALAALTRSSTLGAADPCHPLHRIESMTPRAGEPQLEGVKSPPEALYSALALLHCAEHGQSRGLRQRDTFNSGISRLWNARSSFVPILQAGGGTERHSRFDCAPFNTPL